MSFAIGRVVSAQQLASVGMEKLHADAGRCVAVARSIYQLDSLGVERWWELESSQSHLVAFVVIFSPAARVLPQVTPLCHVRNGEVCRDLVGAH